jgi:hypothetical protein
MEPSPQQHPPQPSQEAMALGLPQGNPLKREHLHDVDPLEKNLQDRLDQIMRGEGQAPAVALRRPTWAGPDNGGPVWA